MSNQLYGRSICTAENEWGTAMTFRSRWVAVVDDDAAVCDSMRSLLEAYNLDVYTYQSAADFLKEPPDIACLIVDYHMPALDGLEFIDELRKRGSQVPVIMITATANPEIECRAAELGIQRVLRKPLSHQALLGTIGEVLSDLG